MHHTFLYICLLLLLHDYNVKLSSFMEEMSYVLTKKFVTCVPVSFFFFALLLIFTMLAASISHHLTAAIKFS